MLLTANNSKEFELPPKGLQVARCFMIVDLGTQDGTFQGQPKKDRKIYLGWELPKTKMDDGRPFMVSNRYTQSLSEKANLRKIIEGWLGDPLTEDDLKGFNPEFLLGLPCMINVVHNPSVSHDKTFANVQTVVPLPEDFECPPAINKPVYFSLDEFDRATFEALPKFLQETIIKSPEYQAIVNPFPDEPGAIDDLPY